MPFSQIGSSDPKYLAATDLLVGDMSNTNYEFLLYDRPVILLANPWLREHFPDIGIKTDLACLAGAIERGLANPEEFRPRRKHWLEETMHQPDGATAKRVIETVRAMCGIDNPRFVFIHGSNSVRKSNLDPLVREARNMGIGLDYVGAVKGRLADSNTVYLGAHYVDLLQVQRGYRVHVDHDLKGKAAFNLEKGKRDYRQHEYLASIDLHITAGEVGDGLTKVKLGPMADRTAIVGYPKSDDLLQANTPENRETVFQELGFDLAQPLVTYAPAGPESDEKPGGSLSDKVIEELRAISEKTGYNVLAKLKFPRQAVLPLRLLGMLRRLVTRAGEGA